MLKPASFRAALVEAVVDGAGVKLLERDPDKLRIFIDKGRVAARYGGSPGFEWRYRLQAILVGFAGDVDAVAFAAVQWLAKQQPEILLNPETAAEAVKFEADILDDETIDLSLELELSEAVDVTAGEGGALAFTHRPEPDPTPPFDDVPLSTTLDELTIGGSVIFTAPPAP